MWTEAVARPPVETPDRPACGPILGYRSVWRGLVLAALLLAAAPAWADHLPNAAAHIGSLLINQNDQFTVNPVVTLTVQAVDNGAGVSKMQFSNDGESWSAPEPFRTTKAWSLSPGGDYPPGMTTVLRTVYVRFQDNAGNWSKAVTDSIVLAQSTLDVPQTTDIWITQTTPTDYSQTEPLGSRRNPYLMPAGTNEVDFDTLMNSLMRAYQSYQPISDFVTNAPASPTNVVVPTIHLGPGVYQTHGNCRIYGDNLAWGPQHGWRIFGAGKDLTMLKAVQLRNGYANRLDVIGDYQGAVGGFCNFELADLTIDANLHEGGTNYAMRFSRGIWCVGNNLELRRVRVKNFGTTVGGAEAVGIGMLNFGAAVGTFNTIIEDCEVVQAQVGNAYKSGMLGLAGYYGSDRKMRYYSNVVIRNCYIDGAAYDGDVPVNPLNYAFNDRGTYGFGIGGCRNTVIEDNLVVNTVNGYYVDSARIHDLRVRRNHFRNVCYGAQLVMATPTYYTNVLEDTFTLESNLVELDPRLYPVGDNYGALGWRWGFLLYSDFKVSTDSTFYRVAITSNVFQFTDGLLPQTNVGGIPGSLMSIRSAEVRDNVFRGLAGPIKWDNRAAFLDRQADVLDPSRPQPLVCTGNRREDNTILEPYPYVLDKSLPRPVVYAGEEVSFLIPPLNGLPATVAQGVPIANPIDSGGVFRWKTSTQDAGEYVIAFSNGTNRTSDSLHTLVKVLPQPAPYDMSYFAQGLRGYWRFEETSGYLLSDSSGNDISINIAGALGQGAINLGVPGIASGQRAMRFGGHAEVLGQRGGIPNADSQLFSGLSPSYHPLLDRDTSLYHPFTIAFWFKVDSEPQNTQLFFTDNGNFFIDVSPGTNKSDNLVAVSFSGNTYTAHAETPANISVGVWHHLAAVYDGVSIRIYVDAVRAGEDDMEQLVDCASGSYLYFGGGFGWATYVGSLDELAVWGRVLADSEIGRVRESQLLGMPSGITPAAPSGLHAQSDYAGSVSLDWQDNAGNESGFVIERSVDGLAYSTVATPGRNATCWIDTLPQPKGTYYYRVAATNGFGMSAYSPVAGAGPCEYALPVASVTLGPDGGASSFSVSATPDCAWSASVSGSYDWIHTSSSGMGPGLATFNVDSNSSTNLRSGTIMVQGRVFTVIQLGIFAPQKANFKGLFYETGGVASASSGLFSLTTTEQGAFSGSLRLGKKNYPMTGTIDSAGRARTAIKRRDLPPLEVELQMNLENPDSLAGRVIDSAWTAQIMADRQAFDGKVSVAPQKGSYTISISGDIGSGTAPGGSGYGTVSVDGAGRVRLAGTLADGTKVSQSATLSGNGQWPLYVQVYGGQGLLLGWIDFTSTDRDDLGGGLSWIKPASARSKYYPQGFALQTIAFGARYQRPARGIPFLSFSDGQVLLRGGNLSEAILTDVRLGADGKAVDSSGTNLKLSCNPSSGWFKGSFLHPRTGRPVSLSGVIQQKRSSGVGFFLGPDQSGDMRLGPAPGR